MILLLVASDERLAESIPSPALDAVTPGAGPAQRTPLDGFLHCLSLVTGTADAVVAGGIKTQGAVTAEPCSPRQI